MRRPLAVCTGFSLFAFTVLAGAAGPQPGTRDQLQPKAITFSKGKLPFTDALLELAAGSGNTVGDARRIARTNPEVVVPAGPVAYWPALDALAKSANVGFTPYLHSGSVVFVDAPYREVPTAYAGPFRFSAMQVNAVRDFELGTHTCTVTVNVMWEPRFEPFYLKLKKAQITFSDKAEPVAAGHDFPVAGRAAIALELRAPAPERAIRQIASVEGVVSVIGPSKMLDFVFDDLTPLAAKKPLEANQEGVQVRVQNARFLRDILAVEVDITNPKGGPTFESFQSWLENNRIRLAHSQAGKVDLTPASSEVLLMAGERARVVYHFAAPQGLALPPRTLKGWRLHYRTPGRIVEVEESFRLENLPLP